MLTIRFNRNNIGLGGEAMDDYKITWRAARVNAGYTLKEVSEITKKIWISSGGMRKIRLIYPGP